MARKLIVTALGAQLGHANGANAEPMLIAPVTFVGSVAAASERCERARTGTPASINRSTTTRPTRPVAPVTSTGALVSVS
jgi:hypothetical protein